MNALSSEVRSLKEVVRFDLQEASEALSNLLGNEAMLERIAQAGVLIARSIREGGKAMSCGNGGSLCDAMHFAEEMTGRFRDDRRPYPAVAIADASHLACVANDYGYEQVFARYVQAMGRKGDVLVAFSTSGTSKNVVAAAQAARAAGIHVVGLTGREASPLAQLSDIAIVTPGGRYADRIQELHIKVVHMLIELVERQLDPANYEQA